MRCRLRTLLILLAVLPPVGGAVPWLYREFDPTAAAFLTIWLVVCVGLACAAVVQIARAI
jgi:hypothetical protein